MCRWGDVRRSFSHHACIRTNWETIKTMLWKSRGSSNRSPYQKKTRTVLHTMSTIQLRRVGGRGMQVVMGAYRRRVEKRRV
jgi:hypothetical protein